MAAAPRKDLELDRNLQNNHFSNWRLSSNFVLSKHSVSLPGNVAVVQNAAVDYLRTRESVLHNHLVQSNGRLFIFAKGKEELEILELLPSPGSEAGHLLVKVAAFDPASSAVPLPGVTQQPTVDCSLAVVQQQQQAPGSASPPDLLLVSLGYGDVRLIVLHDHNPRGASQPVCALPLPCPQIGCQAVTIEAAYLAPSGELRCVMWAAREKEGAKATRCESYLATFSFAIIPAEADTLQVQLQLTSRALLGASALPAYIALPSIEHDAVVLGLDPEAACSLCEAPAAATAAAAAGGATANGGGSSSSHQGDAGDVRMGSRDEEEVEHLDCRGGAAAGMDDDDECDIDPRTLAEAAARLAKYTSEEPEASGAAQQWADLYKETGPDGVGAMGSEPACDLVVVPAAVCSAAGSSTAQQPLATWHLACGASKVLTTDSEGLLGVSDDVDGCVLRVLWPADSAQPLVKHEATVPALAYITAGKVQRKHLLLGEPGSSTAAVLVEGQKFYYVYRAVGKREEYGQQQVVDMELEPGESILGARLVTLTGGEAGSSKQSLVLLTQHRLLIHRLRP